MPYRDQTTVQSWVTEFFAARDVTVPEVSVLEQYYAAGEESGLVVVKLRTASTGTYIQPVTRDGAPTWLVTFEPRDEGFDLDGAGVAKLGDDLKLLAELCDFLQEHTDAVLRAR